MNRQCSEILQAVGLPQGSPKGNALILIHISRLQDRPPSRGSDFMMVAVGFQPTVGIIQMRLRRAATLETGDYDPEPLHQASRRDAMTSRP